MYFLLILFFGSLFGIIFMIGRKLLMLQNGQISSYDDSKETFLKTQYFEELKYSTISTIKKYRYTGLVTIIRLYVKSLNFLKNKYEQIKIKIIDTYHKKTNNTIKEKREVPKFLKVISEYKHKIREIKHKIKEEEENL